MPEPGSVIPRTRVSGELNDVQRRRLDATCKYIDSLLCEIEHALHSPQSESPFPHYVVDVTPAQSRAIEDYIRQLRALLLRTLDWRHMKPEPPGIPLLAEYEKSETQSRKPVSLLEIERIWAEQIEPRLGSFESMKEFFEGQTEPPPLDSRWRLNWPGLPIPGYAAKDLIRDTQRPRCLKVSE